MKTQGQIRAYRAKMKKVQKRMAQVEKEISAICNLENPTKEQMKETVLLFTGYQNLKKIYHELDSIVGSLLMLAKYNVEDL